MRPRYIGAPVSPAERPLDAASARRASIVAAIMCQIAALPEADLEVMRRIVTELPSSKLRAKCEALTEAAREPLGTPNNYRPTPAAHVALASLLSAWGAWSLVVTGRRAP